jgi:predicted RNA-binding protein YlqC (UPF0109 family)
MEEYQKEIEQRIKLLCLVMNIVPEDLTLSTEYAPYQGFLVKIKSDKKDVISRLLGKGGKTMEAVRRLMSIYAGLKKIHLDIVVDTKNQD